MTRNVKHLIVLIMAALPAGCDVGEVADPTGTMRIEVQGEGVKAQGIATYEVVNAGEPVEVNLLDAAGAERGRLEFEGFASGDRTVSLALGSARYSWTAETASPAEEGPELDAYLFAQVALYEVADALGMTEHLSGAAELPPEPDEVIYGYRVQVFGFGYAWPNSGGFGSGCPSAMAAASEDIVMRCMGPNGWGGVAMSYARVDRLTAWSDGSCMITLVADCMIP